MGKRGQKFGFRHSEETKRRLSELHKGKTLPEEQRNNIGNALRGRKRPPEVCEKISNGLKKRNPPKQIELSLVLSSNRKWSEERKSELSLKMKGKKRHSDEARALMSITRKGRILTEEHKKKISDGMKGYKPTDEHRRKLSLIHCGENSRLWKGGVSPINKRIRHSVEYKLWRESVFERDNWTCQKCSTRGGMLHPHHIKSFAEYPELRFAIDNGETLCTDCHKDKHRDVGFFRRQVQRSRSERIIKQITEG